MALETLRGVTTIGGFSVVDLDEAKKLPELQKEDGTLDWDKYDEYRKQFPVAVAHNINTISFKIQQGPIKEFGANGCQVDTLLATALEIIAKLNKNFPHPRNAEALVHIEEALNALVMRRVEREARGVEGFSKA